MRITRPIVLLALAALLAPRAEASRTSVREPKPLAALTATRADGATALAPLAPAARLDTSKAVDREVVDSPRFDLGAVILVESAIEREDRLRLGPLDLLGPPPLSGPPPSYPKTRVRGFELLPPFRVGASASLSLWSRQACGFSCREVVSNSRYDPWGLARKTENGGTNYLGNLGDVVDVEGPVSEALSIGLDYVGNNVSDFLNLDYIVGQVMVAGDSTRSGGEQAAAAGKAVAVTALNAAGGEILGGGAKVLGKVPLVRKIAGSRLGQAIGRAFTKDLGALFRKEAPAAAEDALSVHTFGGADKGPGSEVFGPHYEQAKALAKEDPAFYADPDMPGTRVVGGSDLATARRNYDLAVARGELPRGHHRQGLAFGGGNTKPNIAFTGESTIPRAELKGLDLSFYSGYGNPNAKVLKLHQDQPGGLFLFGPNPRHTAATTFQNLVLRWQRAVGLRK